MYSLKITKYLHTNNNNYFDNSYMVSEDELNNIVCLQLNNLSPEFATGNKVYYHFFYENFFLKFRLYKEEEHTTLIAEGAQSTNLLMSSPYLWANISQQNSSGIDGQILVYIPDLSAFNARKKDSGEIDLNPGLIDYIHLTQLPEDFISNLAEEAFSKDNSYLCSDWDIKLTNLATERSHLGNDIFDFFENDEAYIYRVIFCKDGRDERVGFIDYSSMDKNLTPGGGKIIAFNVFSAEKEFGDFARGLMLLQIGCLVSFGTYNETYDELLEKFANTVNCNLDDVSDVQGKYSAWYPGEILRVYYDFFYVMREQKLMEVFCSLFTQLGLMFKITTDNLHVDAYDRMTLRLFFRSDGTQIQNLRVIEENEGNKGIDLKYQYWGIKNCYIEDNSPNHIKDNYNFAISAGGVNEGFPDTQTNEFFVNAHFGHFFGTISKWRSTWFPSWYYSDENIRWIDIPMYDCDLEYNTLMRFKKITPIIIFSKLNVNNWDNNLVNLAALQYDFLLSNLKKTKKLKVHYPNFFDYTIYNQFPYDGKNYYIEKISNINLKEKTASIEAVEI